MLHKIFADRVKIEGKDVRVATHNSRKYYYQSDLVDIFGPGLKSAIPAIKLRCADGSSSQERYLVSVSHWTCYNKNFKPRPKEEIAAAKKTEKKVKVSKATVTKKAIVTTEAPKDLFEYDFTDLNKSAEVSVKTTPEVKSAPVMESFTIAKAIIPPPKIALTKKEIIEKLQKRYNTAVLDDLQYKYVTANILDRIKDHLWYKASLEDSTISREGAYRAITKDNNSGNSAGRQAYLDLFDAFEKKLLTDLGLRQKDLQNIGLNRYSKRTNFQVSINDKGLIPLFHEVAKGLFP